jgi:8-hydroxy-5-deazaflavin:NADPH oxidoreductase
MSSIGLIGGTGDLGSALAVHLSKNHLTLLGSRNPEKATATVTEIVSEKEHESHLKSNLRPVENAFVAREADIIIVTVPHSSAVETIADLSSGFRGNQILITAVAPVVRIGDEYAVDDSIGSGVSFAERIKDFLPESIAVASAFQTLPARILYKEKELSADVLVATDSSDTYAKIASIISEINGLRPLHLGGLVQSRELERLTAMLLNIGKRNGLKSPTVKFPSF